MKEKLLCLLAQRMQKNFEKKNPDIRNVPEGDFDYIHNIAFKSQDGANLPPCILVTSDSDFLKQYSYDYAKALTENGIENELLNMGDNKLLTHSFMNIHPEYEESQLALEKTAEWFYRH